VYGVNRMSVRHVVAEGRPIVEDGRCTLVDEDTEMDFARGQAERLWARLRDS
jgi:hypothetical protein